MRKLRCTPSVAVFCFLSSPPFRSVKYAIIPFIASGSSVPGASFLFPFLLDLKCAVFPCIM